MISVSEARELLSSVARQYRNKKTSMPLSACSGLVLAAPVKALCFSPPFDQSAMDGYALKYCMTPFVYSVGKHTEMKAGKKRGKQKLKSGEAVRIFTGAALPPGANVVIPQEQVKEEDNGTLNINNQLGIQLFQHIRKKGSQFRRGETILSKGAVLSAPAIALAAASGHSALPVYALPDVCIIVCGDELQAPGKKLGNAQVYESNSVMLKVLLQEMQVKVKQIYYARDNEKQLKAVVTRALKTAPIVLISGGISVGKYDLVLGTLQRQKVKTVFYKVRQKPGKPLYFGTRGQQYIFGLPGNPAASLTCFYEYVKPFILELAGNKEDRKISQKRAVNAFSKKAGLTNFLKAQITRDGLLILPDQESYKLNSFAAANCLAIVKEETENVNPGDLIEYHLL